MSSPKVNRSKAREAALQVVFCQQFTDREMSVAATSVEAMHTVGQFEEAQSALSEFIAAAQSASKAMATVSKLLAESGAQDPSKKPPKPPAEGTLATRLQLQRARAEALDAIKKSAALLRNHAELYGDEGFCGRLIAAYDKNRNKVHTVLDRSLEGWSVRRLTAEDHATLSLGVTELLFLDDVPPRVTINEYIELAKRYGDADSTKLVNGVLDRVARDFPKPEPAPEEKG